MATNGLVFVVRKSVGITQFNINYSLERGCCIFFSSDMEKKKERHSGTIVPVRMYLQSAIPTQEDDVLEWNIDHGSFASYFWGPYSLKTMNGGLLIPEIEWGTCVLKSSLRYVGQPKEMVLLDENIKGFSMAEKAKELGLIVQDRVLLKVVENRLELAPTETLSMH